ncbi:MAG: hypothetical protein BRC23_00440 [Parcubacteria group bacterium SW_4_49_11]|jgi:hypothetical protein|nr:MAG: hypothetical protein BRC23_00440 [Parcubacteria group bacterium SW_4_49_11]
MNEHTGSLSFHILEDRETGITDVFLAPEHTPSATEDDLLKAEKVFSIVNQRYFRNQDQQVDRQELCYFLSKESSDVSDYCSLVQEFVSTVCDFSDRKYTIYLKVSIF